MMIIISNKSFCFFVVCCYRKDLTRLGQRDSRKNEVYDNGFLLTGDGGEEEALGSPEKLPVEMGVQSKPPYNVVEK